MTDRDADELANAILRERFGEAALANLPLREAVAGHPMPPHGRISPLEMVWLTLVAVSVGVLIHAALNR